MLTPGLDPPCEIGPETTVPVPSTGVAWADTAAGIIRATDIVKAAKMRVFLVIIPILAVITRSQ